jgi:hypothetical protein
MNTFLRFYFLLLRFHFKNRIKFPNIPKNASFSITKKIPLKKLLFEILSRSKNNVISAKLAIPLSYI